MPRQPSVTNLRHREFRLPWRSGQRRERSVGGRITVARGPAPPGSAPGRSFSGRAKGLAVQPSGSSESFTIRQCGGASRRPAARKTSSPTPGGTCTGFARVKGPRAIRDEDDRPRHPHPPPPECNPGVGTLSRTCGRGRRGRTQLAGWVDEGCEHVISASRRFWRTGLHRRCRS
jgi:hypothetical protein